ncbi:MAG: aminotransferase class V-fold PLP-dependent enzyme [Spirochaetales bacterium]|nr:aminotransferase class V-fold PLP-dependent enzyme [Spirochaetales bacterium]
MEIMRKSFASDNNSGVHPVIMKAIEDANRGHVIGYGDDPFTEKALKLCKEHFGEDSETFFVFTGTAANVLGVSALIKPYNAIICAQTAHLNEHECGSPEKYTGCKVIALPSNDGKITVDQIKEHLSGQGNQQYSQVKVIAITQPTELGVLYTIEEIQILSEFAHSHGLYLVMDGARIANAAVRLKKNLKQVTLDCGVDVLSFGGTKNGMMFGEAVVFFSSNMAGDFKYIRKQGMNLGAKMRFISAQFNAYLTDNLWYENALSANTMASYLETRVKDIKGISIPLPVSTNALFPILPPAAIPHIRKKFFFYMWDEKIHQVRWMTSFDTEKKDVDEFAEVIKKYVEEYNFL